MAASNFLSGTTLDRRYRLLRATPSTRHTTAFGYCSLICRLNSCLVALFGARASRLFLPLPIPDSACPPSAPALRSELVVGPPSSRSQTPGMHWLEIGSSNARPDLASGYTRGRSLLWSCFH